MSEDNSTGHIIQSLLINIVIAVTKGIAAAFTGSGALMAEAIHSGADCANQVLLLVGVNQAKKPPDEKYPLGYGRNVYFWSFMVALMLFSGGGVFSIYEGLHKISEPEEISGVLVGIGILIFSLLLESGATISNIKEINKRKETKTFFQYLKETKDSDLIVVFGENSAAVIGLFLALFSLLMAHFTHDSRWDGFGSVLIGLVLVLVAIFLATEVKSLLMGESADPLISKTINDEIQNNINIETLLNLITIQQGPGEVMVAIKMKFNNHLNAVELSTIINEFEKNLKSKHSEIKWCFIEPDLIK